MAVTGRFLALVGTCFALATLTAPGARGQSAGEIGQLTADGARESVRLAPEHDSTYYSLSYPGGDPGTHRGTAADVVVRALRNAGVDLQVEIYEDVLKEPALYRVSSPDASIDHRRVKNLSRYLSRWAVDLSSDRLADWLPGDIVFWSLSDSSQPNHVGVVTDAIGPSGRPMVVHHLPRYGGYSGKPTEDDVLVRWRVLGHYRVDSSRIPQRELPTAGGPESAPDERTAEGEPGAPPSSDRSDSQDRSDTQDRSGTQPDGRSEPVITEDRVPSSFAELEGQRKQEVTLGDLLKEGKVDVRPATARMLRAATGELLEGARSEIERAPRYDSKYTVIDYPNGDPAADRGASVDMVIRSFRTAGVDLQRELHEDVVADREAYGIEVPDANIDHRRVRNLDRYFERNAESLPLDSDFRPGDVVFWDVRGGDRPRHLGIVSDSLGEDGTPQVMHHLPRVGQFSGFPSVDNVLFKWRIVGHYRATGGDRSAVQLAEKDPEDPDLPPLEPQPQVTVSSAAPTAAVQLVDNRPGDRLGESAVVGDFDGDGRDDLAIGSPLSGTSASDTSRGRVMVFRGAANGLVPWRDLWPDDSGASDAAFGRSMASGDFDGDGLLDLAVGAPGLASGRSSGWVHLYRGTSEGLEFWRRLGQDGLDENESGDQFGAALAAGDIDGDGVDDLAVGTPHEVPTGRVRSGRVYLFRGSTDGLAAWQAFGQEGLETDEDGDLFGWSVALGDVTGDSLADLAVGAPGEGLGRRPASGAVFLFTGTTDGVEPLQEIGQLGLGRNEAGDDFGWALTLADFNRDGRADLVVGAPGEAFGSIPQSGWVFVFYGSQDGVLPWMSLGQDDIGLANEPQDRFGWSLTHGDFDGDERADLVIGIPGKTDSSGANEGSLLVCRGGSHDLVPWVSLKKGEAVLDGAGRFGSAVVTGDFDGDRFTDLVVGAPGLVPDENAELGSVFLYKGASQGFDEWLWRGTTDWVDPNTGADTEVVPEPAGEEAAAPVVSGGLG